MALATTPELDLAEELTGPAFTLTRLIADHPRTQRLQARRSGEDLVLYLPQTGAPGEKPRRVDLVRFTRLGPLRFGVAVAATDMRWSRVPLAEGTIEEMFGLVSAAMPKVLEIG